MLQDSWMLYGSIWTLHNGVQVIPDIIGTLPNAFSYDHMAEMSTTGKRK